MPRTASRVINRFPLLGLLAASLPLFAQTPGRVPLTGAVVAAALTANGLNVDGREVELPASLATSRPDPQLRVTSAEVLPDGRLRVRLACRQAQECQPFLATVHPASASDAMASLLSLRKQFQPTASASSNGVSDHLLAGRPATLVLESTHMRITLPVLAIDSGAPGTEVRVTSLDRKQTYRAVVASAGTVRGTLP